MVGLLSAAADRHRARRDRRVDHDDDRARGPDAPPGHAGARQEARVGLRVLHTAGRSSPVLPRRPTRHDSLTLQICRSVLAALARDRTMWVGEHSPSPNPEVGRWAGLSASPRVSRQSAGNRLPRSSRIVSSSSSICGLSTGDQKVGRSRRTPRRGCSLRSIASSVGRGYPRSAASTSEAKPSRSATLGSCVSTSMSTNRSA